MYATDADLALQSTQAVTVAEEAYNLIDQIDRMLLVPKLDQLLEREFGHSKLSSRTVCRMLKIKPRYFENPDDLLDEVIAGYRRAGLADHQIKTKLQGSIQVLPDFRRAIARHLDRLSDPT